MAMERQDYPAMLPQLQPAQAVDILNDRVRQVAKLNTAVADWLLARRQLEEQYATGLRRLAQRQLESGDIGVFSVPWTSICSFADQVAESHSSFASRIEIDVERPLREFATNNREMTAMSTMQGNLASLAKDVERTQQKVEKVEGKGERSDASKVTSARADFDTAKSQWDSQAPYVFEALQALDEKRVDELRAMLTQFQTMEVDQLEKNRDPAEQCLNALLNVQTEDEIKTFVLKSLAARPTLNRTRRSSVAGTPSRPGQSSHASNSIPAVAEPDEELRSQRSASVQEDKKKRRLKGLSRIGTVMNRKRESRIPPTLPSTSESPERKPRASPFSALGNKFGRSRDQVPQLEPPQEPLPSGRPSLPPQIGSEAFLSPSDNNLGASSSNAQPGESAPQVNGTSMAGNALPIIHSSHQGDLADLEPPKPIQPESVPSSTEPEKDTEGFSVPPSNLDPISQAQQEAAMAGEDAASPQFNVNIRDAPIKEEGTNADTALASMTNILPPPNTTLRPRSTVRGRRQDRNSTISSTYVSEPQPQPVAENTQQPTPVATKEAPEPAPVQATAPGVLPFPTSISPAMQPPLSEFGPIESVTSSTFSPQTEQTPQSAFRPESRSTISADRRAPQSIRSVTTTGSHGGIEHPELNETGLNTSIVETISARFENGNITSSSVIGEIAMAYNPADFSSPFGNESIRLDNFSKLEKVAPNPAFINPISGKDGEYTLNLSNIAKMQVAFKYQAHVGDGGSPAPLLLAPAFRIEPKQVSAIVAYSLTPGFLAQGKESITLSNVMLALYVDGAKATGCQSKPVGTFNRDKNAIFWQLNDITLTPGAAPQKLLARFTTESEAKGGSVDAKWELVGHSGQDLGSGLSVSSQTLGGAAGDGADPFADESAGMTTTWKAVPVVRKLTSGSYIAK